MANTWPSEVRFASLLIYSPKGKAEYSVKSRHARDAVKRGETRVLELAMAVLARVYAEANLEEFLGPDVAMVPAPGSAPYVEGGLWTSALICDALIHAGRGREVLRYLRRTEAVPKSAFAAPGQRPSIDRHYETIAAEGDLIAPRRLLIVDDVVTRGRTLFACARRLRETFPGSEVACFGLIRTMGLQSDVERVVDPCRGRIYLVGSDCDRDP